jgi:DNA-binding transcriptional LysR family regulator
MRDRLDLNAIDLNLLPKFRALYRHRNVSEASRELHLTQSALSNALARMRYIFEDELFVRTTAGMEPTPFAERIAASIDEALAKLEVEFAHANGFEPERSSRTFRIAMTGLGETWLAPKILSLVRACAPDIVVSTVSMGDRQLEVSLAGGAVDFAVGHVPNLDEAFRRYELAIDELVCLARSGHPLVGGKVTLPALMSCSFAEVIIEHGACGSLSSRWLNFGVKQNALRYRTVNVLALPYIVANTDLIALMPAWFAARYAAGLNLDVVRLAEPPMASVSLIWHENIEDDPGHAWMRSVIQRAAAEVGRDDGDRLRATIVATDSAPLEAINM